MHDHDNGHNASANRPFAEVLRARQSRRDLLSGGLGAAAAFFAPAPLTVLAAESEDGSGRGKRRGLLNFSPVPLEGGGGSAPRISDEYQYEVIIPWGDPLAPGHADTIGIGHDGMHYFQLGRQADHGLLAINHEYGDNEVVLGKPAPESLEEVRWSQYNHGVSIIELAKLGGAWQTLDLNRYARRIHVNTPVTFSGPAADSPLLANAARNPPQGTVNNCANGHTPWGTYLTCEENFNGYFGATQTWSAMPEQERYGLSAEGSGYGWHHFDPRFDLSDPHYENEVNRFGWIVEIDPRRPDLAPVKRTALGRFKHEGIAIVEGQGGRIVGYMGDDERFDYLYKFVSSANWRSLRARGLSPLDHGSLYVARFNDDGSGDWLELDVHDPRLVGCFRDQADVLVHARLAADLLGATPMDRPEWTSVAPNGLVYCTLTNNTARQEADAANPQAPNPSGHIIRWLDSERHTGLRFDWDIFLLASSTHGSEAAFGSPDGLWADPDGRLFIQTDGGQPDGLNDQMLVADILTGEVRRLFEGVKGAEVTGITVTPDRRTLFCNLQHPDPDSAVPRDATVAISRKDGGTIGS